jgi:hypothetical protein
MAAEKSDNERWGGRLWVVTLVALALAAVIILILWPRPLAWESAPPTESPWTPRPGLYEIPTVPPPQPSPTPEGGLRFLPLSG